MRKQEAADELVRQVIAAGLPAPEREYLFAPRDGDDRPLRRWRFDLAWPEHMVACEIDGSIFTGGRHGGAPSAVRDMEKLSAAAVLGWSVIRVDTRRAVAGAGLAWVAAALKPEEWLWPFEGGRRTRRTK